MTDLAICIVTLNARGHILSCLDSFLDKTRLKVEVVVVDNHSTDGTVDAIRARFPTVELIVNDDNLGFSRAVNQGLKTLDARYYLLLNPDVVVIGDALDRLAAFMDERPEAGICTPRVMNGNGTFQYQCRRGEARPWEVFAYFSGLAKLFPKDPRFTGYLMTHLDNDQVNEVKAVSGGSMLIRREVIEQIGYLDERFFAYQEDTDYCFQARKAGWKIYYVPDASMIHYGGRGGSGNRPYFGIYQWHRSYYLYYRKNLARDYPFWFHPFYYLAMAGKLVFNLITVFFSSEKIVGTRKP